MNVILSRILIAAVVFVLATAGTAAAEPRLEPTIAGPAPDLIERMVSRGPGPDLIERMVSRNPVVLRPDDRAGRRASMVAPAATSTETAGDFDWGAAGIGASVALAAMFALAALRIPQQLRSFARAAASSARS